MSIEGRKDNRSFNIPALSPSRRIISKQDPDPNNEYKWYRLYDDGWVEQGGVCTIPTTPPAQTYYSDVPLLIVMADLHYQGTMISFAGGSYFADCADNLQIPQSTGTTIVRIARYNNGSHSANASPYFWKIWGMSARGATQQTRYIIKY